MRNFSGTPPSGTGRRGAAARGRPEGSSGSKTRARLLAIAATLFARNGFAGVTLADVAGEAGLTAPAIYNHFASKDELFIATVTGMYAQISTAFAASVDQAATWQANLECILATAESLYREDGVLQRLGGVARLEAGKAPARFAAIIEAERSTVRIFVDMMALAKAHGELPSGVDHRLAGELVAAMVLTGIATVATAHSSRDEFRAIVRTFRSLFLP